MDNSEINFNISNIYLVPSNMKLMIIVRKVQ